nr:uncharacterized protein LOC128701313 isoform X3 [Cherax quadricarinatus]
MTQELENYLGLLILHYITSGWEDYAWILINIHTANCINSSLCISLLWPLARHIVQVDNLTVLSNIKVPSHLTSALDIARVGVLCELHRGYAAYSLFQNNFSSASSFAMHTMIGIFVRYCENCPEKEATSPWEKILLWKYEPFGSPFKEQRKDMFNIGWLKVRINARDVDKVCEAYNHLCKELFAPSSFFIYITCCAVTFLNEMGERKKSFHVLKEVRRLKANDESIFTALIPTDKESGMCLLSELSELGHLVCERRVPLSASTWDRLISFIMTFSNLTLTIDLLICAMQIKKFKPEVETLKKLLLDCSRGGPALMQPLSKLVCALSADYLCRMRSSLEYLVNFFADAPPPEQQVKNIIIRHCQTHGINLVLHSQVSAYKRKSESSIYDRSTENRLQCSFKVHNKDNFIAQFRNLSTSHFGVPNMDASSQNLPNLENLRLSSDFRYQSSSICYSSPQKILLKSRSCSGDTYSLASRTTDSRILVCDNQDDQSVLLNHASKHHLSTSCWGQYHERPNSEHENLPSVLVNEGANSRKLTQYMNKGRIELNEPANDWKIIIVPQYKKSFGYSQTSVQNKCSKLMPIYDQSQKQSLCRGPLLDVSFPILGHVSAPLNSMLPTSRIQRHFDKPSRLTGRSPKHDLTKKILCERKSECKLNPCQHKQSCLSHDTAGGLQLHKGIHQCSEEYIRLQDSSNELSINNSSPFFHTEKILVSNVQPKPWCSSAHQSSFLKQKPGMSSKLSSSVRDKIDLTTQKRAKASAKNVKEPLCHTATVSNINNEHLSQRCSFVCVTKENCALQSTVSQSDLKQKLTTMPEPWASPREESTILSLTSDLIIDVEGCLLSPKAGSSEVHIKIISLSTL